MSLDIAMLNDEGSVEQCVPIGVEAHHRLMQLWREGHFELMARVRDYYAEAEFFHQELGKLAQELLGVRARAEGDPELERIIDQLLRLVTFAREAKKSLVAIPD